MIRSRCRVFWRGFERQYQVLFGKSLARMAKLLDKTEDELALEAIKTVWKSHGRYTEKGGDTNIQMQQVAANLSGAELERSDAQQVLEVLREMRNATAPTPKVFDGAE